MTVIVGGNCDPLRMPEAEKVRDIDRSVLRENLRNPFPTSAAPDIKAVDPPQGWAVAPPLVTEDPYMKEVFADLKEPPRRILPAEGQQSGPVPPLVGVQKKGEKGALGLVHPAAGAHGSRGVYHEEEGIAHLLLADLVESVFGLPRNTQQVPDRSTRCLPGFLSERFAMSR